MTLLDNIDFEKKDKKTDDGEEQPQFIQKKTSKNSQNKDKKKKAPQYQKFDQKYENYEQ